MPARAGTALLFNRIDLSLATAGNAVGV